MDLVSKLFKVDSTAKTYIHKSSDEAKFSWQDREIRFDISLQQLSMHFGEKIIDSMNHSNNKIKIKGYSGCDISIVSIGNTAAVRKSTKSKLYSKRLIKQMKKQEDFKTSNNSIKIPEIIEYDDLSFTMEY